MLFGLNASCFGSRSSERTHVQTNLSHVIPWYVTNPSAANGAAPTMHTHDTVSTPSTGFSRRYIPAATATASTEKMHCRKVSPKNMDSE